MGDTSNRVGRKTLYIAERQGQYGPATADDRAAWDEVMGGMCGKLPLSAIVFHAEAKGYRVAIPGTVSDWRESSR